MSMLKAAQRQQGMWVIQTTNAKQDTRGVFSGNIAYEQKDGGLATNALFKLLHHSLDDNLTMGSAFKKIRKEVENTAKAKGVFQRPVMDLYHGATEKEPFGNFFRDLDEVLIINPVYSDDKRLHGAERDVVDFLLEAHNVLKSSCQVSVVGKQYANSLFPHGNIQFSECTQALVESELKKTMLSDKNVAVFVFGHGVVRVIDGVSDEYLYFQEESRLTISGRFFGGLIADRQGRTGKGLAFVDMCNSKGFPDRNEVQLPLTGRALPDQEDGWVPVWHQERDVVQDMIDRDVFCASARYAAMSLEGYDVGSAKPLVDKLVKDVFEASFSTAQRNPVEPVRYGPLAIEDSQPEQDEIQGRNIQMPAAPWFEAVRRLSGEGLACAWNTAEMLAQGALGSGLGYVLGPLLVVLVVGFVLMGLAAFGLYTRFILRNHRATLGPALLVMVITTVVPYLCDPAIRGQYLSIENSFYIGSGAFLVSVVTILLSVMANWKEVSTYQKVVMRSTGLVRNSCALGGLALEMFFMNRGLEIQQTMHVRTAGGDAFVVYFPMKRNGTIKVCAIPLQDGRLFILPNKTGYSLFDKQLTNGTVADYTCLHDVYKMRVANRSNGDVRNLQSWIFQQGKVSIPLGEMHAVNSHAQQFYQINASTWAQDPLMARLELAGKLDAFLKERGQEPVFDSPLTCREPPATMQEKLAAPVCLLVEWVLGIVLSPVGALFAPFARGA